MNTKLSLALAACFFACAACAPTIDGSDVTTFAASLQKISDAQSPENQQKLDTALRALLTHSNVGEVRALIDGMDFDEIVEAGRVQGLRNSITEAERLVKMYEESVPELEQKLKDYHDFKTVAKVINVKFETAVEPGARIWDAPVTVTNGSQRTLKKFILFSEPSYLYGERQRATLVFEPALRPGETRTFPCGCDVPDLSEGYTADSLDAVDPQGNVYIMSADSSGESNARSSLAEAKSELADKRAALAKYKAELAAAP